MTDFLSYTKIVLKYIFIFIIIHSLHTNFFLNDHIIIILIFDIFLTTIIGIILSRTTDKVSSFILSVATITFILIATLYSVLIPVMLDRSITVNMFLEMYQADNHTVTVSDLRSSSFNSGVISKRLNEQVDSGVIVIEDGKVILTEKGKFIAAIFYYNNKLLNIKHN